MRSLKSGLIAIALSGLFGTVAVIGCSADGGGVDLGTEVVQTEPEAEPMGSSGGSVLPPNNDDKKDPDAGKDAGKKDAGKKPEAGVDAGPPPPVPGATCATADAIAKKTCGACGRQEAVCLSTKVWSDYGPCGNELAGGCTPAATQACGNCGTQTCSQFCGWGTCTGQPSNSCAPGGVELSSAGCAADTFRQRTCKADCSYASYSLTCEPPPTFLNVAPAVGGVNSSVITLKAAQTQGKLSGSCPTASVGTTLTPYNYFEVRNPTTKIATVTIYHSQAPGGGIPDTVMAAYDGATAPTTEAARKACVKGLGDYGSAALTGDANFAALTGSTAVTIPAGGSVTIYSANYYAYSAGDPDAVDGMLKINVKTDGLN